MKEKLRQNSMNVSRTVASRFVNGLREYDRIPLTFNCNASLDEKPAMKSLAETKERLRPSFNGLTTHRRIGTDGAE